MKPLAASLLIAASAAVAGAIYLFDLSKAGIAAETGKWLLSLATVLVGGGLLSILLKVIEVKRAAAAELQELLRDIISVDQAIDLAFLRLYALPNADVLSQQMDEVAKAGSRVRVVSERRPVRDDEILKKNLSNLRGELKDVVLEYASKVKQLESTPTDDLWLTLCDPSLFPRLHPYLTPEIPESSPVKASVRVVKDRVRLLANV